MTRSQLALFPTEAPDRPAPTRPGTRHGVRWSAHNGRVRCDDCRADQAAGRLASVAPGARWRRTTDSDDRYLCYVHAQAWRERDAKGGD